MKTLVFCSLMWLLLYVPTYQAYSGEAGTEWLQSTLPFRMAGIGSYGCKWFIAILNSRWTYVARPPTWGAGSVLWIVPVLLLQSGSVVHCSPRLLALLSGLLALSSEIVFLFHKKWPHCIRMALPVCFLPVESGGSSEVFSFWSVSVSINPSSTVPLKFSFRLSVYQIIVYYIR